MRTIPLTRGYEAIVDDEDYEALAVHSWYALVLPRQVYACRRPNKREHFYMHRVILGVPRGALVDHRDHNGLHNWRGNLRSCTDAQNKTNRRKDPGRSSSDFKGVSPMATGGWRARICSAGQKRWIGRFDSEMEAALAYDEAARTLHGEFACLNFPDGV